jgi:hypothetical protein
MPQRRIFPSCSTHCWGEYVYLFSRNQLDAPTLTWCYRYQDREDFTPYRFRIHIPGKDIIVDQYPTDLLGLLQKHGVANPFEYDEQD